eukprot:CAMPEP_0117665470 /NCGR_PEP_ID=MMETSP0804-20121206/9828_1 /TAXON_ID=1074897 /ORGANISM="Tetraselmis astigmatica, Strain CCMP880" /LENGTH=920 /DNA_ID=CAMNT_0005472887 /DNA_START=369 /DNA_END=3131 /DNA_ORIENTATION=+
MSDTGIDLPTKRLIQRVLRDVMQQELAELYFDEPVDAEALGIPEYYDIIKNPMDLGTVMRKLNRDEYEGALQLYSDIRLVWKNCFNFNEEDSEPFKAAIKMQRFADNAWKKAGLPKPPSQNENPAKVGRGVSAGASAKVDKHKWPSEHVMDEDEHRGVSLLKSLSKKGVAPGPGHGKHDHHGHGDPQPKKPKKVQQGAPATSPRPPGSPVQSSNRKLLNHLGGLRMPPLPGGLQQLPKRKRTGGHGDPDEVAMGTSGGITVMKKIRSGPVARKRKPGRPRKNAVPPPAAASEIPAGGAKPKGKVPSKSGQVVEAPRPPSVAAAVAPATKKSSVPAHPLERCLLVVDKLMEKEEAEAFVEPVDPEQTPGYFDVVSRPMDLGTIAAALRPGLKSGWGTVSYKSVADVVADILQVWENCKLYNDESAGVSIARRRMEAMFRKYCEKYSIPLPASAAAPQKRGGAAVAKASGSGDTRGKPEAAKKKRGRPPLNKKEPDEAAQKKKRKPASVEDDGKPMHKTAPRPPARIPNSKSRNETDVNALGPMELDEEGFLVEGFEAMGGDDLFTGFEHAEEPMDRSGRHMSAGGQPSSSYDGYDGDRPPRCSQCMKAKGSKCGTAESVIRCERRAENGLPTWEDIKSNRGALGKDELPEVHDHHGQHPHMGRYSPDSGKLAPHEGFDMQQHRGAVLGAEAAFLMQQRRQAEHQALLQQQQQREEYERAQAMQREREAALQREREMLVRARMERERLAAEAARREAAEHEAEMQRQREREAAALEATRQKELAAAQAAAAMRRKDVEEPVMERLMRAAEMQQAAAVAKLKTRQQLAEKAIKDADIAIKKMVAVKQLLADVDAALKAQHDNILDRMANAVPEGCRLVETAGIRPIMHRNLSSSGGLPAMHRVPSIPGPVASPGQRPNGRPRP